MARDNVSINFKGFYRGASDQSTTSMMQVLKKEISSPSKYDGKVQNNGITNDYENQLLWINPLNFNSIVLKLSASLYINTLLLK